MAYFIGAIGGILGGLFGAGSGLVILPSIIHFLKTDEYKARGTTLCVVLIITIASSFFYYKNNYIDFKTAAYAAVGGVLGGFIGAKILHKIPEFWLKMSFYGFMIFAGIKMII